MIISIRHILAGLFFFHLMMPMSAATYYFSSTQGNDNRSIQEAQNPSTPWQSLEKLNSQLSSLNPGDSVLFKCGETFYGSIVFSKLLNGGNPVILSAYGEGNKPVISGFTNPGGWVQQGAHILKTNGYSGNTIPNILLVNDIPCPIGRFPNRSSSNGGYLTIEGFSGNTSITGNTIATQPDWSGGDIVIRKNRWVIDRNAILSQVGNTINYLSETSYAPSIKFGYFIQNHPSSLDAAGEWYYNENLNELGVYLSSVNANTDIKVSTVKNLVTITESNAIVLTGLQFIGANETCLQVQDSRDIRITNCEFFFSGVNAINATNTRLLTVEHLLINYTNNNACQLTNCSQVSIRKNTIKNTGTLPGMGKGDSGSYEALLMSGDNYLVEWNTIDSTGYIPVTFRGDSIRIKNNLIDHFCLVKDDGGGIYTWNNTANAPVYTYREITGNIILNGAGAGDGTDDPARDVAHGIYIDDNSNHVKITANTVAHCKGYGLFLHNSKDVSVTGNTLFDNSIQLVAEHDNIAPHAPVRNIVISGNILFSRHPDQVVAAYKTIKDDIGLFGNFSDNYYCRPINEGLSIQASFHRNNSGFHTFLDVDGWKSIYGKDNNSQKSPVQFPSYKVLPLTGKNLYDNGSFNANISGLYAYAAAGNCRTTWVSSAGLDGGALSISFTSITGNSSPASLVIGTAAVYAGKSYLLTFTMKGGSENKNIDIFLRKSLAPYQDLTSREKGILKNNRTENTFLLQPLTSEENASIVFDIPEQENPLYIDNIHLQEVTATKTNPDEFIRFHHNGNSFSTNHLLPAQYIDAKKIVYNGQLSLAPFSSAVLMKQPLLDALTLGIPRSNERKEEKETDKNDLLKIRPVPVHDLLQVFIGAGIFDPSSHLLLQTSNGQVVRKIRSSFKNMSIDVSSLSNGHYIISYSGKGRKVTRKFLKQ